MSKQTKQYIVLGVVLLGIVGVYFFFIRRPSPQAGVLPTALNTTSISQPGQKLNFLPHGSSLDLKSLNDPRLQTMIAPSYPTVDKSELGVSNPFSSGQ